MSKKSGIKLEEKVFERLGRLKQKYRSIHKHYTISFDVETGTVVNRKTREKRKIRTVKSLSWRVRGNMEINETGGIYFLRTSIQDTETIIREGYNTIREEEAAFRTLKTGLDLRPIYHKRDDTSMAHLNLGLIAYWIVNTVRFQLKGKEETSPVADTNGLDRTPINFCR